MNLRDWSAEDRPREKYVAKGPRHLSDAELIAILLRSGTVKETVVDLAKRLLALCDNRLSQLSELTLRDLKKIYGIGETKAVTLLAAFELGRRLQAEDVGIQLKLTSPQDVHTFMLPKNACLDYEEFWVLYFNQASVLLKAELLASGGLSSTMVDVRLVVRKAIESSATGMILCHNHPSGKVKPSKQDDELTAQINVAAGLLNIEILDHIIVSKNAYYSYAEDGKL